MRWGTWNGDTCGSGSAGCLLQQLSHQVQGSRGVPEGSKLLCDLGLELGLRQGWAGEIRAKAAFRGRAKATFRDRAKATVRPRARVRVSGVISTQYTVITLAHP